MRIGQMNEEDKDKLKERVRHKIHPDLKDAVLFVVPTRNSCSKYKSIHLKEMK